MITWAATLDIKEAKEGQRKIKKVRIGFEKKKEKEIKD